MSSPVPRGAAGPARLSPEEAVLRARQAEILAQGRAFVFAAEEAAALQLRHDPVDEIVEPRRADRGTRR